MNWYSGYLEIKTVNGETVKYHMITFAEAQRILDTRHPNGSILEAIYFPSPTSMEAST